MTTDQQVAAPAEVLRLFSEHEALFLNKADDLDVFPRLIKGIEESKLQSLVNDFYTWVAMYEFTRQWLVEPGDFEYDFGWLSSKFTNTEMKSWVDHAFMLATGITPDNFKIIQRQ